MPHVATACSTLENVDVECTHCGVRMTSHVGSSKQVRYFHCPSCSRWTTSMYSEVLRADTKMRTRKPVPVAPRASMGPVKERLAAWLQSLSVDDPYQVLGVVPEISEVGLRERYLALARHHHPDHGGAADQMRRINAAYERVLSHREQRRVTARVTALPTGS